MALHLHVRRRQLLLAKVDKETPSEHVRLPLAYVTDEGTRRLPKLLINVYMDRSLGPVQVLMSSENIVGDLVKAVVEIYVREKRRPLLKDTDHRLFNLHYSQFSLESLKTEEKLINLGSRKFYLCKKPT